MNQTGVKGERMLVYFAALLSAAIVLFLLHPKREANRWASFFLLFASVGGLAGFIREDALPALAIQASTSPWLEALRLMVAGLEIINHTLTPYGVLVFCIVYSERLPRSSQRTRLKLLLLIPPAATAAAYAAVTETNYFFLLLLLWAAPYYGASCWLLIASFVRERNRWRRKERLAVAVLVVPTLIAIAVFINVASVWDPGFHFFNYVAFFIAYSLLAGVAFAFGSGVLGVKVKIERDPLESAMKAVGSGTAMLNHTIKNEIAKISMCAENVKASLDPQDEETAEQLDLIVKSADHMQRMVGRIHGQTQHIILEERPLRLAVWVAECLLRRSSELERNGIAVETGFECDPMLLGDRVHISEVISNILSNAIEAMQNGGRLIVRMEDKKRGIELSFRDNGPGIPKERLQRVFEPFYTTKTNTARGNYGLGLTYCYQVMRQSGGSIEVESGAGAGTTVKLLFPAKKRISEAGAGKLDRDPSGKEESAE
ncbi:histidine kinase [Paenibacillus mesophilus]|uniref:sensor histidine kinase n=1 Tax=Paenibacillus mesophilus TaxID=2582849 RepID=UPI00110DA0D2|nr:sensor histidine kinase [Paenibacillus mesophilus]TMV50774.1 histidine kinase [Paenibacillus mesophilus]